MPTALPLLEVQGISKRFCRDTARSLRYGIADLLRGLLPIRPDAATVLRPAEFCSLDQISFELHPGEALAIGGRNGAGKTTLLRVLAGLLKPDSGTVTVRGTINSVIELGQGLNPMLTGRENAEIGLAWRGVSGASLNETVSAVEEFAALGEMFESAVQTYSAGMRVRLAFAIAVSISCDILLLDEVLAVGDLGFQRKCIDHMQRHLAGGGALILVSHNPVQMQALCRRGILLEAGKIIVDAPIEQCLNTMFELQKTEQITTAGKADNDAAIAKIDAVKICDTVDRNTIHSGQTVSFEIDYSLKQHATLICTFSLWTRDFSTQISHFVTPIKASLPPGSHRQRCEIPNFPLAHGTYALRATVTEVETLLALATFGYNTPALEFDVCDPLSRTGLLARNTGQLLWIEHAWQETIMGDNANAGLQDSRSGDIL